MKAIIPIILQLLQLIPRDAFKDLVREYNTERAAKGFTSWAHFISLVSAQLIGAGSLRDIVGAIGPRFKHFMMDRPPTKSSISYANSHRDWRLFRDAFHKVSESIRKKLECRHIIHKIKFNFDLKIFSIDSTTVTLCLKVFDWAKYRRAKGGIKIHTMLEHDHYLPMIILVTEAREADIHFARALSMPQGSIVVMDRGYVDFALFHRFTKEGTFFVTRPKTTMNYSGTKTLDIPTNSENSNENPINNSDFKVVRDVHFILESKTAYAACPEELRMVSIKNDAGEGMDFITNNKDLPADIIAALYKDRWAIESFFKTIKQNLIIKSFLGTSENAVKCQIWAALTAIMLVKYLQLISKVSWNFSNLINLLRWNIFTYEDVHKWIDERHCEVQPPSKEPPGKREPHCSLF
jgi:hypothetical protein